MAARIVLTLTTAEREEDAAQDTLTQLRKHVHSSAGLSSIKGGVLYSSVDYQNNKLQQALRTRLGSIPYVGATSCLGVGTSEGVFLGRPVLAGLWFLGDGVGFGVSSEAKIGDDHVATGGRLARGALASLGTGTSESSGGRFTLFHSTPGSEEELLRGISVDLGANVPLVGGTAADNDLSGQWSAWCSERSSADGVALAVCDWPGKVVVGYQSGYMARPQRGKVTKANGRTVFEIDGRPAAEVYDKWLDNALQEYLKNGESVLGATALTPLGVVRGKMAGMDAIVVVHPERVVLPEKALSLFAKVEVGEELVLMHSYKAALISQGGNAAKRALRMAKVDAGQLDGAVLVYCAGCMLAIKDEVPEMLKHFESEVGTIPYLAVFTFGEQGQVIPRRLDHGNLMTSVLLLAMP